MSAAPPRIYLAGEPDSPFSSSTGKPVVYQEIRQRFSKDNLFEDPDFPADNTSIGKAKGDAAAAEDGKAAKSYIWQRPHEICQTFGIPKPDFAVAQNEIQCSAKLCSEYDLAQGGLGDCFYLSGLGALTTRPEQISFVVPEDNFDGFDEGKYCGAFHFRFYSMAECKWVDIVIDDRIPCTEDGRPAFAKVTPKTGTATACEFWPALAEKAYAKFYGNYSKISGGHTGEALEDFTGGFTECIEFNEFEEHNTTVTDQLSMVDAVKMKIQAALKDGNFAAIGTFSPEAAHERGVLDGYTHFKDKTNPDGTRSRNKIYGRKYNPETEEVEDDHSTRGLGLLTTHAYTVVDGQELKTKDGKKTYFLLKVKNPHATREWFGPFGDTDDKNWARMEKDLRSKSVEGSTDIDEGVFWIEIKNVVKYFKHMYITYYGMTHGTKLTTAKGVWPASLQEKTLRDSKDCLKHFTSYRFEAKREESLNLPIPAEYGNKCFVAFSLVINLAPLTDKPKPNPKFNFYLYKIEEGDVANLTSIYHTSKLVQKGGGNHGREASKWLFVEAGEYLIIPVLVTGSNGNKIPKELVGKDIEFAIRLFTENETTLEPIPPPEDDDDLEAPAWEPEE